MVKRRDKEHEEQIDRRLNFERLYRNWAAASAVYFDPDQDESDDESARRSRAVDDAARWLLVEPAFLDWMVWRKWEVLELWALYDARDGQHVDNRVLMALGCIKADIVRLGIGSEM